MLHLTIGTDVARLLPFDDVPSDSQISEVHQAASNLGMAWDVAVARDGLLDNMSTQDDPALLDGGEGEEAEGEDKATAAVEGCEGFRLLGHKSAVLTLDKYGHLFPDDLDAVADAFDTAADVLWTVGALKHGAVTGNTP
jgi:hypothetical protein